MTLEQIEKIAVLRRVLEYNCDLEAAGKSLGITKRTLYRMLDRWKIPTPTGGNPHTTKWSEALRRRQKMEKALSEIQNEEKIR